MSTNPTMYTLIINLLIITSLSASEQAAKPTFSLEDRKKIIERDRDMMTEIASEGEIFYKDKLLQRIDSSTMQDWLRIGLLKNMKLARNIPGVGFDAHIFLDRNFLKLHVHEKKTEKLSDPKDQAEQNTESGTSAHAASSASPAKPIPNCPPAQKPYT